MPNWPQAPSGEQISATHVTTTVPKNPAASEKLVDVTPQFIARKPLRTLDDLIVSDAVRTRIDLAINQLSYHHELYHEWNLKKIDPYRAGTAVNFYGAPGTGKSLAAEALAERLSRTFIDVNYAELESKYVGDTSKNIVRSFEQAAAAHAVLVFNEADSILGSRLSNVTQSADHSVNASRAVMLSQLDAFDGLVVFTTNFPRNYDAAFVRRIIVHVEFDLPNMATRTRLWRHLIPDELPLESDLSFTQLAALSDGLTGGDIVNAVKVAAAEAISRPEPLRRLMMADLGREIAAIVRAKTEIGKPNASGGRSVHLVSLDEVDSIPTGEPKAVEPQA